MFGTDEESLSTIAQKIGEEAAKHGYGPGDFMVVVPAMSPLVKSLEARIQAYWHEAAGEGNYVHVDIDSDKSYSFCDGSKGKTIVASIHRSRKTRRSVVFFVCAGLSPLDAAYESLLYVAVTRQKKQLYIGVVQSGFAPDDVLQRLLAAEQLGLCKQVPGVVADKDIASKITDF